MTSLLSGVGMLAVRPQPLRRASGRQPFYSLIKSRPSVKCPAILQLAGLPRATLFVRLMRWMALWVRVIDRGGIQFRILNKSRGPAVRGPRAQADRKLYREAMQVELQSQDNLSIRAGAVEDLLFGPDGNVFRGLSA